MSEACLARAFATDVLYNRKRPFRCFMARASPTAACSGGVGHLPQLACGRNSASMRHSTAWREVAQREGDIAFHGHHPWSRRSAPGRDVEASSVSRRQTDCARVFTAPARLEGRNTTKTLRSLIAGTVCGGSFATPHLDGTWLSRTDGEVRGSISGSQMFWPDGSTSRISYQSGAIVVHVDGRSHSGVMSSDGSRLRWSDGDVWSRVDNAATRLRSYCGASEPAEHLLPFCQEHTGARSPRGKTR